MVVLSSFKPLGVFHCCWADILGPSFITCMDPMLRDALHSSDVTSERWISLTRDRRPYRGAGFPLPGGHACSSRAVGMGFLNLKAEVESCSVQRATVWSARASPRVSRHYVTAANAKQGFYSPRYFTARVAILLQYWAKKVDPRLSKGSFLFPNLKMCATCQNLNT